MLDLVFRNGIAYDRQKLIDYYQKQGFFEVKVTPVTRPGKSPGLRSGR